MKFATIFDMDGVLVDTHDLIWNSVNNILGRYNVHLNQEEITKYLGRSLKDDISDWNKRYNLSLELGSYSKSLWAEQRRFLKDIGADKNLVSLLGELEENNVLMGVGTSSHRKRAKTILKWTGLRKYFPVLVGAEDIKNHKPSPDVFLETAKRLGVSPEKCVVIEDSYSGILAAKIGKMRAIGYLGKHNSLKELVDADLVITDFSEIDYARLLNMFSEDFKLNNHFSSKETRGEILFG